jgi:hypothetical protein
MSALTPGGPTTSQQAVVETAGPAGADGPISGIFAPFLLPLNAGMPEVACTRHLMR